MSDPGRDGQLKAMQFQNDQGTQVDPVPFLVIAVGGFLVLYSFAPSYFLELGLALGPALVLTTGLFVCTAVVAYHRFVWRARPALRAEVPTAVRLHRLFYAIAAGIALSILLLIPLFVV